MRRRCRFPGCTRPARARNPRGGRPPAYCSDPLHNRASRFALAQVDPTTSVDDPRDPRDAGHESDPLVAASLTAGGSGSEQGHRGIGGTRRGAVGDESVLVAALRRAERAEAVAADRARLLDEAEARAERREAQLVDRLMVASEQIAMLRASCDALSRDRSTEPATGPATDRPSSPYRGAVDADEAVGARGAADDAGDDPGSRWAQEPEGHGGAPRPRDGDRDD